MDYAALKADAAAMRDLDAFLAGVATMPESEGLATWLDAYNATVVKSVVDRYPLRGVRDVPGFFDHVPHRLAGAVRTLDATETLIRTRFHDARVHAALNCGARSCPALASRAFTRGNVEASLDRLAHAMVANEMHVHVTRDGRLGLSEIFTWYDADFTRDAGSVVQWLRRYDAHHKLAPLRSPIVRSSLRYDWRLNDFPSPR